MAGRHHKKRAQQLPPAPANPNARSMDVVVDRFVFTSPEQDYAVVAGHDTASDQPVRLTGPLAHLNVGETVHVTGRWSRHNSYGHNFKVFEAKVSETMNTRGIVAYLQENLHGIGPVKAKAIVDHFGPDTFDVLDADPTRILEVPGCGKLKIDEVMLHWEERRAIRKVMLFLQQHGVTASAAARIYRAYGEQAIGRLTRNPYCITELDRIGFATADDLALNMGLALNDPRRIDAGLVHVLRQAEDQGVATGKDGSGREQRLPGGNCFLAMADLIRATRHHLGVESPELIAERIVVAAQARKIVVDQSLDGEERRVYSPRMYNAEVRVAAKVRTLAQAPARIAITEPRFAELVEQSSFTPTEEQLLAIRRALTSRVSVLTGGPGSGKSSSTKLLCDVLDGAGLQVELCAPTGKAAKRITEATGHEGRTIHRLLEWQPLGDGFARNARNPLDCDVLVVDETSMVDLLLADKLLQAVDPYRTHVVFVGDTDQLEPVGCGKMLHDIITSQIVPVTRLTKIFRQAARSMIIQAAYAINTGKHPNIDVEDAARHAGLTPDDILRDFFFVPRDDNEDILRLTIAFAAHRIPRKYHFNPITDIQVIAPQHKGAVGVDALNGALQNILNANGAPVGVRGFRVGDKLLCKRNDYTHDIMNGEFARIVDYHAADATVTLDVDGRHVKMGTADVEANYVLAYAVTCHSMQGSSAKAVVIPMTSSFYTMLSRSMLYTAVTRAEQLCVVVGQSRAVQMSVGNSKHTKRNSALAARIAVPEMSGQLV